MKICVFVGPTLRLDEAREVLGDAEFLPPAAVGDVYRAARRRPHAIAIVDGFFERTPAIWHKEILWAMAEGVHVFGSSSMGALRAAELARFGMVGVGNVFEAYHTGIIEDDDEVAVAHASRDEQYRVLSDAMVNVRATLAEAELQGFLDARSRRDLEQLAKGLFYAERKLEVVVHMGVTRGLITHQEGERIGAWLPSGRVDQKRLDALELLRLIRSSANALRDKKRVCYELEHTHTWEELLREVGTVDEAGVALSLDELDRAILDELKLRGQFSAARRAGTGRVLALEEIARIGRRVEPNELRSTSEQLRRQRGLLASEDFRTWLAENRLDLRSLENLLGDEAGVTWLDQGLEPVSESHVIDHLRVAGTYPGLHAHVVKRDAALRERGHDPSDPQLPLGAAAGDLWRWYFDVRLGRPVPENLAAYALTLGFQDKASLQIAVLKEYLARVTS